MNKKFRYNYNIINLNNKLNKRHYTLVYKTFILYKKI